MLFSIFDDDLVKNESSRLELLELIDLSQNFNSKDIPQFIIYSTDDGMVNMKGTREYINIAEMASELTTYIETTGQEFYLEDYLEWLDNLIEEYLIKKHNTKHR